MQQIVASHDLIVRLQRIEYSPLVFHLQRVPTYVADSQSPALLLAASISEVESAHLSEKI
jgi:hypothetical protein